MDNTGKPAHLNHLTRKDLRSRYETMRRSRYLPSRQSNSQTCRRHSSTSTLKHKFDARQELSDLSNVLHMSQNWIFVASCYLVDLRQANKGSLIPCLVLRASDHSPRNSDALTILLDIPHFITSLSFIYTQSFQSPRQQAVHDLRQWPAMALSLFIPAASVPVRIRSSFKALQTAFAYRSWIHSSRLRSTSSMQDSRASAPNLRTLC